MNKFRWKQLSIWDLPRAEYYTKRETIKTGLSSAICTYLLVKKTDISGDGFIRTTPIKTSDVTDEMIGIADTARRESEDE